MQLNQFYTQKQFSDLLVNSLEVHNPIDAIDLGFGDGDLLHAVKRRWSNIKLIGIDIDEENISKANTNTHIQTLKYDGFHPDLPSIITGKYGNIELLVCNPPYYSRRVDQKVLSILTDADMQDCISRNCKNIPAELIFLAQNLRLLTARGQLGIILPAGLVSGERWKGVREFLFNEYSIHKCIQLPTDSFKRTDAQAFILTISKKSSDRKLVLSHVEHTEDISICMDQAIERSDYTYYRSLNFRCIDESISRSDFQIMRGSHSQATLRSFYENFIHTSHLSDTASEISVAHCPASSGVNAIKGDIVIGRVGRRCLGRAGLIKSGHVPVSDCIIIVRPTSNNARNRIWEKLKTIKSRSIFYELSLGVGAKYLTHKIVEERLLNK